MRGLTIRQPWAYAITHLGKRVENRTWNTNYRGPVLIHVATQTFSDDFWKVAQLAGRMPDYYRSFDNRGCVVAIAELWDSIRFRYLRGSTACTRWAAGPWCFMLRNVIVLPEPVKAIGQPGLWRPSPTLLRELAM